MGFIRYVSTGRKAPSIKICASMNNGVSWQNKEILPGQSYPIPSKCTNLLVDNVPYNPYGNYEIREGKIVMK